MLQGGVVLVEELKRLLDEKLEKFERKCFCLTNMLLETQSRFSAAVENVKNKLICGSCYYEAVVDFTNLLA